MIALVRHPAVQVAAGVCYGRLDVKLAGSVQAVVAEVSAAMAGTTPTVWSSPAQRCLRVAEAIISATRVRVDTRLQELDFGLWEGLPWDRVPRDALDAWAADVLGFAPPGGETGGALVARVAAFYADLPRGDHVVVSHGGPLKVLAALAQGKALDLAAPAQALASVLVIPQPFLPSWP